MILNKYPDGTSYMEGSPEHHRVHTFKVNSYEDLWHLNQFVDNYTNVTNGLMPTILIPNLIDAQADRRFAFNQSCGLKLVCNFLNDLKANFKVFHPHNAEVVEALIDNVEIIDNSDFINEVLTRSYLEISELDNNLILMSSDAGGFKPLSKLCDKIKWEGEMYSASKARSWSKEDGTKFVQQIDREDFGGKDILIVDDISVFGGTFKGLATLLKSKNVGKLYLAVSHMTVQNLGMDPVTDYFDRVFTTNSKFDDYYCKGEGTRENPVKKPSNLEIIKQF